MGIYATLWVSDKVLRRPVELAWGYRTWEIRSFNRLSSGSSLRVCEVRGMALVVEPAAEEDDGVASPHGSLADP